MGATLIGALGLLLLSQQPGASIEGVVRDGATGDQLAGAVVALTDLNRSTVTGADGRYAFRDVRAGPQHVTVRRIGHEARVLHALVPSRGRLEINVALTAIPIRLEIVTVRRSPLVRGLEEGDRERFPDRAMTLAAMRDHPLLSEPDAFHALGGGGVTTRPEAPSGVNVRGGSADHTAYVLDDIPVFSPYHTAGMFSGWNPDALDAVQLSSATPRPEQPDALSGTIAGRTRAPGERSAARGSVSTSQVRLTFDGPLGRGGYMLSLRTGFPGALLGGDEASYLTGEMGDRLAKVELPALGGRARFLIYSSEDEIGAAARAGATVGGRRHQFEWHAQSIGGEWRASRGGWNVRALGWQALGSANARWADGAADAMLMSVRRDAGALTTAERVRARSSTLFGIRATRSITGYDASTGSDTGLALHAVTPVVATFAQHTHTLATRTSIDLGGTVSAAAGGAYLAPRARLRHRATSALALFASWARTHQFSQSLRNGESITAILFPAELYVGAGAPGVPVGGSDQAVLGVTFHPASAAHIGIQVYDRRLSGLIHVAPREARPFATAGFSTGTGNVQGLILDASLAGARYSAVASYGAQRVRMASSEQRWTPEHAATHVLEAGVIAYPTPTLSLRFGGTVAGGRRATMIEGSLEWEACNLLDAGCEFAGSPQVSSGSIGGVMLPTYLRIDAGIRKHWHVAIGGRQGSVALFGTVSNVLGRSNVLTYARGSTLEAPVPVTMRPLAPLVVGLDWQF